MWKEENELAKQEERWIGWAKPKLGKLEPAAPKPGAEQGECSNAGERNGDVTDNKMSKATAYMMVRVEWSNWVHYQLLLRYCLASNMPFWLWLKWWRLCNKHSNFIQLITVVQYYIFIQLFF